MLKKTSKYLIFSSMLLVFSLLLVSCQSLTASTEEMDRKRAIDAWGANLTAQSDEYFEELEKRERAIDAWGANLTAQSHEYFEKLEKRERAIDAWGANLTAQEERYIEDFGRQNEKTVMVDASSPQIVIQQIKDARTIETIYEVVSDGPGWVVFHADQDGKPGAILEKIWVSSGYNRIARSELLEAVSSEPIHVMLHYDLGWVKYFEYPRTDGPVFVDQEMIDELCLCSY